MLLTAIEHPFRDLVITGDGIQGNILSKTEPIPASIDVETVKSENATLASKTSKYTSVPIFSFLILRIIRYISLASVMNSV